MTVACSLVASPEHDAFDHPENPGRFAHFDRLKHLPFSPQLSWLPPAPATVEEIARVHTAGMINGVREACRSAPGLIDMAPTYVAPRSFESALNAAGGALACARAVWRGEARSAFALVRPPGHHAEPEQAMGFCIFNNLAVALCDTLEGGLERALIVDFDAHHGNGTQRAFWDEPRVAYLSTHQAGIYPGSGLEEEAAHARGRIVNVPLPAYAGDRVFDQVMLELVRPLAERWRPGMIFVSAGFDSHWSDPITSLGLSTTAFFHLVRDLGALAEELCQGKLVLFLEGGYDPAALADNVGASLAALAGESSAPDRMGPSTAPEPELGGRLARLRRWHGL